MKYNKNKFNTIFYIENAVKPWSFPGPLILNKEGEGSPSNFFRIGENLYEECVKVEQI